MLRYNHLGKMLRDTQFFQLIPTKIPGLWHTAPGAYDPVDLPDDRALQAANNLPFRQPLLGTPGDVLPGPLITLHPHHSDSVQR